MKKRLIDLKIRFAKWLLKEYLEDRYVAGLVDIYVEGATEYWLKEQLDKLTKSNVISKSSQDR